VCQVEWKIGRKKGEGVHVREKKNKLSMCPDRANHLTIVTHPPLPIILDDIYPKCQGNFLAIFPVSTSGTLRGSSTRPLIVFE